MADLTLEEAVAQLRVEIDDRTVTTALTTNPPSHLSRLEPGIPVSGLIDGVNMRFRVRHYPVLTATPVSDVIQVEDQLGTAFVVDEPSSDLLRGIIALTAAPTNPPSTEIRITYFSQFFFDTQLEGFVQSGVKYCGVSAVPTLGTDPLGVGPALELAVLKFAAHLAAKMLATKTADFFDFGAGGKNAGVAGIPKMWKSLADELYTEAEKLRADPYLRQGRREAPATGITAFPSRPYTPTR